MSFFKTLRRINALYLLFLVPILIGGGLYFGRQELLNVYLYRLGLLSSFSNPLVIVFPETIPPSGISEKFLGRFLSFLPWDLKGELDHPSLGLLPFEFSLHQDKGSFSLKTGDGVFKAHWEGKKRVLFFDRVPLNLLPSLPKGEVSGEWKEEAGHDGHLLLVMAEGEEIALSGARENVMLTSPHFSACGKLQLNLLMGEAPSLKFFEGEGKLMLSKTPIELRQLLFDSGEGILSGLVSLKEPFSPIREITFLEGLGAFQFDLLEKRFHGNDFEASFNLFDIDKQALFTSWELGEEGASFEVWIEHESLLKGLFFSAEKGNALHFFEGSSIFGIDVGPLKITNERAEGVLRSDLTSLLKRWAEWHAVELPPLPRIEGAFDGEFSLTRLGGECQLKGRDLSLEGFPLSSASFNVVFDPKKLLVREGLIEEILVDFELYKGEMGLEIPFFGLSWRDLLNFSGSGVETKEGLLFSFDRIKGDLNLLEAIPSLQNALHRFDLQGSLLGNGSLFFSPLSLNGLFTFKILDLVSKGSYLPFMNEMTLTFDKNGVTLKGGTLLVDGQFLSLKEGVLLPEGIRLEGEGKFSFPWLSLTAIDGPWTYQEDRFRGQLNMPPFGEVLWEKGFETPLIISTPLHDLAFEVDDYGEVKGKWGEAVTFDISLKSGGKGEGKAKFIGFPTPEVTLESPLPLEAAWVFPTSGVLPFKIAKDGLEILPGGELFSEGKGIRYEKVEGFIGWRGELNLHLLPKASRLPLYWLERGEIAIRGSIDTPKLEVKWR